MRKQLAMDGRTVILGRDSITNSPLQQMVAKSIEIKKAITNNSSATSTSTAAKENKLVAKGSK